jgi:outer membrane receptor protein involved in Fe transport
MTRTLLFFFFIVGTSLSVRAQSSDSAKVRKDSISIVIPIPELGSVEPFGGARTIITEQQIIYREYRSLYDIIAGTPGVFVRDLASAGQQNQLVINGIQGTNIAILVDGIPYNDYYTGTYNLWMIPVDAVDRVEVLTGADALFYDGKSGGGAINIITKNFNNNRAVTRLRYSQGVSGYTHTDAMFAQNIMSDLNLSFALAHYGFGSNKAGMNFRARFSNSNTDSWMLRSKVRYNVTNTLNVSFSYSYDRTWTGLHGGVDYYNTASVFNGLEADVKNLESFEKQFNSHYNLTAAYFPFEDSVVAATLSFYSFDRLREYRDEENRGTFRNQIYTKRDFPSTGRGMKMQILSRFSGIRFLGYADMKQVQSNDIITVGAKSEFFSGSFFTVTPFGVVKDYQDQFSAHGGVEGTLSLGSSLQLFGGITQNLVHDKPGSSVNNSSVFTYAERIKETFSVLEAGIRFSADEYFSGEVTYRRTTEKDPVIFDTVSAVSSFFNYDYFYSSSFTYDALSAFLHVQWNDFHAEGTGTYVPQPKRTRYGKSVTLFPELTMNGSIYFQGVLANGALDLKIGMRGNFYSEQTGMRPYDEFGVWIPSTEVSYGPNGSVDLFAIGKIGDAYVHIIWENISGSQYLLAPVYPMYDQNIRFGLSWGFLD